MLTSTSRVAGGEKGMGVRRGRGKERKRRQKVEKEVGLGLDVEMMEGGGGKVIGEFREQWG